jgi:hypothetical protein
MCDQRQELRTNRQLLITSEQAGSYLTSNDWLWPALSLTIRPILLSVGKRARNCVAE